MRAITLFVSLFMIVKLASAADPCVAERAKLCPGKKPGGGLEKCLAEKQGQLSPTCRALAGTAGTGACQSDAEKLCSGFGMNDGLIQCLSDHKGELSDVCAASIKPSKN